MKNAFLYTAVLVFIMNISCVPVIPPATPVSSTSQLLVSEDSLYFVDAEVNELIISLNPAGYSEYSIASYPDWVIVHPTDGVLRDKEVKISIASNLDDFNVGSYSGLLVIETEVGSTEVYLFAESSSFIQYLLPTALYFEPFVSEKQLLLKNEGNEVLNYLAKCSDQRLKFSNSSGLINPGDEQAIDLTIDLDLFDQEEELDLIFTINDRIDTVSVFVNVVSLDKVFLETDVVDAEYTKLNDEMVFVSSEQASLFIYNVSLGIIDKIDLEYIPTCVSISLDGKFVAIGHDAHISYVNLINRSLIKTTSVACKVLDIVLADNGWVYAFPERDQWANILCLDLTLENPIDIPHEGYSIFAGTLARMHPSGNYIYGADNGLSPSDIEKYDIQSGVAEYMYDSPYHGDYYMRGNLWFTEDGSKIITRGKTVLNTSTSESSDMKYGGEIPVGEDGIINWVDHSTSNSSLFVISSVGSFWSDEANRNRIEVYDDKSFVLKDTLPLEKYYVNAGGGMSVYDTEPHFVFCNSEGSKIIVVGKAFDSPLEKPWSMQFFDISD